ncbi:MAG: FAD-binding dehydrogenase [Spirochaetae bacterium HGW-Spirochaetae-1]|jgi:succinate dehydrogenase/fumarate reductase flavoprotein subunit|nr:MAG: FAD-binding dehydrogenase [Spirochaetae bacterium HGW-Spirochaetae-1]
MKKREKPFATNNPWYGAEPDIPQSAVTETIETEILICGAGNAGMAAAIVAGNRGVKTIVIEKDKKMGLIKPYMGAIDSKAQKAVGDKARIDKEEIIQELVHYSTKYTDEKKVYGGYRRSKYRGANKVDEKLVRLWADESGPTFDFLAEELSEYGIRHVAEYDIGHGHHGPFKAFPVHTKLLVPFRKGGPLAISHAGVYVLEKFFMKKVKSYGVKLMFNTCLVKVIKEGNRVLGVIARKKNGKYIRINTSKGVLIATGGYAANEELVVQRNPEAVAVSTLRYVQKGNLGDGIRAGVWAGGEKDEYPSAMVFDRGPIKPGGKAGAPIRTGATFDSFFMASQPFMKVNMNGKRFTSESVPYDIFLYPLQDQKNGVSCIIWDANYWKHIKAFNTIGCSRIIKSKSKPKTFEGMRFLPNYSLITLMRLRGLLKKSRTIEGLAKKLKLPPEELKATVERYNEMARRGEDKDFGKDPDTLLPLVKPPYYGITNAGWLLTTMDGLRINTNIQVVDTEGNAIEGLYAAGDVAGGFFGDNLYPELCVGVAVGKTMTFARHAILHMTGNI